MISRRTINESVAIVLESMGITKGGKVVHISVPGLSWPNAPWRKLTEYAQDTADGTHGTSMPKNVIAIQWSGSHIGGGSNEMAAKSNSIYLSMIGGSKGTVGRGELSKVLCVHLARLNQSGHSKQGSGYLSIKGLTQSLEMQAVISRIWNFLSLNFGAELDQPNEEDNEDLFVRFGLIQDNLPPNIQQKVEQHEEFEDDIRDLYREGVTFQEINTIRSRGMSHAAELRSTLDRLSKAGVIADYEEDYSQDGNKPMFTILSEGTVDLDKGVAILESDKGGSMAYTVTENEGKSGHTLVTESGIRVATWYKLVQVVNESGVQATMETHGKGNSLYIATEIAKSLDNGKTINEAVEPFASKLITD